MEDHKSCSHCREFKSVREFYAMKTGRNTGRFSSLCRFCEHERAVARAAEKRTSQVSDEDRFWSRTSRAEDSECVLWRGTIVRRYGQFKVGGKKIRAHRFSWSVTHNREIPDGMWVLHSCDNPPCVNPDHLRLGTAQDNSTDMVNRGRSSRMGGPRGETHPKAKLNSEQVREIRDLYSSGVSVADLCAIFHLTSHPMRCLVSGKTWKSVS